jgi:ketosteroid isomerase-like protein
VTAKSEVRKASKQLYAALNRMLNGDAAALADIWSHSAAVTTMHPVGGRETGWKKVRESWEQLAKIATGGEAKLRGQAIQVAANMAYELGVEHGHVELAGQRVAIEHRVTNIYRREAKGWKVVHHHTDASQAMMEVLSRLQGAR